MEFADKPEQEIIEAAQQGNEAAMEHLLKRYPRSEEHTSESSHSRISDGGVGV